MSNAISWFEIPVEDLGRAQKFYQFIFNISLQVIKAGAEGPTLALFPVDSRQGVSGALAMGRGFTPAKDGVKIYLNAGEDLAPVLNRVEEVGGKVAVPKTQITSEFGYMAAFIDTEGNWIGLHSMK
jgi:predicted enzyme related to lactoylglutathione lyase